MQYSSHRFVRDENQAIAIARFVCGESQGRDEPWRWHASLHGDEWYVWLGVLAQPKGAPVSTTVRASDGYVWDGRNYAPPSPPQSGITACEIGLNDNGYPEE